MSRLFSVTFICKMIRRASPIAEPTGKRGFLAASMPYPVFVYCSKCGEIYRRIAWNNRGKHSTAWPCYTRVEHGPTACDAPTIQESDLQAAVVQAINLALGTRESMMATLQENVEAVIWQEDETSSEGIEVKLLELQKELRKLWGKGGCSEVNDRRNEVPCGFWNGYKVLF